MASINTGRVVVGGLVGGVVANVCDTFWSMTVMKDDMAALAQKFGTDPAAMQSMSGIAPWIVVDFVLGLLVVWTYAAIRPRLGQGPGTAIAAGFMVFLAQALLMASYAVSFLTWDVLIRGGVLMLVSALAGALAGGWVYAEDDSAE